MDVGAIILLNSSRQTADFAGHHLATIDVLGRSPLLRIVHELQRLRVSRITLNRAERPSTSIVARW